VVEIGSNDGYLIKQFQGPGNQVVGVDSSTEMCEIARQAGVECVNSLFDQHVGAALELTYGPA
jgi:SAM-dependent methyltransferase